MAILQIPKKPSKIVIVGEAPGKEEVKQGKPFVGPSGRLLTRLCSKAGLNRFNCYITNVVDVNPIHNNFSMLPLDVVEKGRVRLKEQLEEWKPNVVLAVGAKALEALTGLKQITRYRGSVMPSTLVDGLKIVATLHPANLLRGNMRMAPIVVNDIAKAVRESVYPEIRYPKRDIEIVKDKQRALELLKPYDRPIVIDIETAGHILTAFGVATSPYYGFSICIDLCRDVDVLKAIARFCNNDTPKMYHNALYDVLWLAYYLNICTKNIYFDTMIAQHVCYPIYPKSLGFCASVWTDEPYWKDEGKDAFDPKKLKGYTNWDQLYTYNVKDCLLTYEIYEKLRKELKNNDLERVFQFDIEMLEPLLFAMLHGVDVDTEAKKIIKNSNEAVIEKLNKIAENVIPGVNVNSHKQLKKLFYEDWKFSPIKRKGKITVDAKALSHLEAFPTPYKPIFGLIRNMKDFLKRRTFYNITADPDNRVRTAFKITGTISGRLASAKGITGSGSNLQNFPKPIRRLFVPPPGHIWIQGDLSQAEARIVAALCQDMEWLRDFDEDDVHWRVAEFLFKKPRTELIKKIHRQMAKKVSHACIDDKTEVLTPDGWIKVFDYSGQKILQVDPYRDGAAFFVRPDEFSVFHYEGNMIEIDTNTMNQCLTPEHTLPYYTSSGYIKKVPVSELIKRKGGRIFNYAKYIGPGVKAEAEILRLFVAAKADANFSMPYNIRWRLKKQRKIDRLTSLLNNLNIKYRKYTKEDDIVDIHVVKSDLPSWFCSIGFFDLCLLLDYKDLQIISEELSFWDGYTGKTMRNLVTKHRKIAEEVQLVHKLSGLGSGNIHTKYYSESSYGKTDEPFYEVRFNARKYTSLGQSFSHKVIQYYGNVYNFAVPSGFYLVRRKGKISVTGNTHYLMSWNLLRELIKCDAKTAKQLISDYYAMRPNLHKWQQETARKIRKDHELRTPYGRRLIFPATITEEDIRQGVSFVPQSCCAQYNNAAWQRQYKKLSDSKILIQVHDSLLHAVPDNLDLIRYTIKEMKRLTEVPLRIGTVDLVIPVDFEIGYNWYEMKECNLDNLEEAYENLQNEYRDR